MDTIASSTHPLISSDRVEGTAVYNASGEKLGTIAELMIDKRSGQVRFAVLDFGGFLGMGTDKYPLPWQSLSYDTRLDGYVVPIDKDKLKGAPSYVGDERPAYDLEYDRQLNSYWGL